MPSVEEVLLDELFSKYKNSPNVLNLLNTIADPLQDCSDAIDYLLDHMSIDEAEGELLDFIASWIGVYRLPLQEDDIFLLLDEQEEDPENHHSLTDEDEITGGYLSGDDGLPSIRYPGEYITDEEFRFYIRAKAATYGKKATRDELYNYVYQFGTRVKITEGNRTIDLTPYCYEDMTLQIQYHILNKGMKPNGAKLTIIDGYSEEL